MSWQVMLHQQFDLEFRSMHEDLQDELLAHAKLLEQFGAGLGRPTVDTLTGSRHTNMKELRFNWRKEVWRIAFCFDPGRRAILLTAGDKRGANPKRFYKKLIKVADDRYDGHLAAIKSVSSGKERGHGKKS